MASRFAESVSDYSTSAGPSHSRQLLKMLRRDTLVGGVATVPKNVLPHPLLLLRILRCTLMTPF